MHQTSETTTMQGSQQLTKPYNLMSEDVMLLLRHEYCSHANVRTWLAATDFDDEPASPQVQRASCNMVFVNALSILRFPLRKSSASSRASQRPGTSIASSVASSASAQYNYSFGTKRFNFVWMNPASREQELTVPIAARRFLSQPRMCDGATCLRPLTQASCPCPFPKKMMRFSFCVLRFQPLSFVSLSCTSVWPFSLSSFLLFCRVSVSTPDLSLLPCKHLSFSFQGCLLSHSRAHTLSPHVPRHPGISSR